ncbi:MAG: glutamate synthase [Gammaproteobacteria bacterium]|nr:MAG: glutamate synthase [Gammaproteobacteria bacterium]
MNQPPTSATSLPSPLWTTNKSDVRMTGTWRSAVPDYRTAPSPCHGACPVNGEIATWIQQIKNNDYHGAWLTLVENNPFPAIAGRICHHPCEGSCNRLQLDETVGICNLERFIGDMALKENWQYPAPNKANGKKVAIIGSGPAGLSAAYQLARKGYQVALYESRDQLGGLMRYGIPSYRLEKNILDGEIQRIINLGVEFHFNSKINNGDDLQKLSLQYDALFLATGASRSKALPSLDYSKSWVVDSADFLASTNLGETDNLGKHLLVIGGGSAAIDVARSARRLGKTVTMLSLEPEELLPAQRVEVEEAQEEGIEFVTAAMMQSVDESSNSEGLTINCVRIDFKQGQKRGEFSIDPIAESEFTLTVDGIIPSIGQDVDLSLWNNLLEGDAGLITTSAQWQTNVPGIFAGGDVATMDRFVSEAIGIGKQASYAMESYIQQTNMETDALETEPEVEFSIINSYYYPLKKQHKATNTEVSVRLKSFNEVQNPLSTEAAIAESDRCFSCGSCVYCDSCFYHCPDMAIIKLEKGYQVKKDYCKGCGLCVAECPTGSITMREEF